jgi:hypothetical protein
MPPRRRPTCGPKPAQGRLHAANRAAGELAPNLVINYRVQRHVSGARLRMRGTPVTVDVVNDTDVPSSCTGTACWFLPKWTAQRRKGRPWSRHTDAAGIHPAPGGALVSHTPWPDWTCTGHIHRQYGFLYGRIGKQPGNYDQEVFLRCAIGSLHSPGENEAAEAGPGIRRPEPERPATWIRAQTA